MLFGDCCAPPHPHRAQVYFEVAKPQPDGPGIDWSSLDDSVRFIQYQFPKELMTLNNIGTT